MTIKKLGKRRMAQWSTQNKLEEKKGMTIWKRWKPEKKDSWTGDEKDSSV